MSIRVVARVRPLLDDETEKDVIVRADTKDGGRRPNMVKLPNPKNEVEEFSFAFNGVFDRSTTQEELFTAEVAPHVKALFQGLDVTIFAYGVTGTGKTHTMRGGLKLADRGVIPRLLSNVFRRGKKIAKDTNGATTVHVALSYYEIYNDKVFDLLESPEKRTPSGLPLREANGKTVVVGLSERSCEDLKDFERLYIEANNNRVTAATKLNAHSSRSHAILRVKVTQTTGDMVLESTASAIDLAGSEDNRRTENNRERLVESAAINKSLFVLSQCVDAISRGDKRIPYRESKMTRILSLGQNNGITVMILNLAPIRSYHLDTLSSLNVSSRAKRIEVREIENEVVFKQPPRATTLSGTGIQRQPLRPLTNAHNVHTGTMTKEKVAAENEKERPVKAFNVYSDRSKPATVRPTAASLSSQPRTCNPTKRKSEATTDIPSRPTKIMRPSAISRPQPAAPAQQSVTMSAAQIEQMVERKVQEILACRVPAESQQKEQETDASAPQPQPQPQPAQAEISDAVQRRLEALERKIDDSSRHDGDRHGSARSEGMRLLLRARRLKEKGDDAGALTCYESARSYFPGQAKLMGKIEKLRAKLGGSSSGVSIGADEEAKGNEKPAGRSMKKTAHRNRDVADNDNDNDSDYSAPDADAYADESYVDAAPGKSGLKSKSSNSNSRKAVIAAKSLPTPENSSQAEAPAPSTPRMRRLLYIVNSHDVNLIKGLHGFGPKKARDLVERLEGLGDVESLEQLGRIPGFGGRVVERVLEGIEA